MADNEVAYTESPTKATDVTEDKLKDLGETPEVESPARAKTRTRSQILGELLRVRKKMDSVQGIVTPQPVKPYTPDTYNSLASYYNKYIVDYMIHDQEDVVHRPGWGLRATSLKIVEPEVSWRMDNFPGPIYDSVVPRGFYKTQTWSKNLSGLEKDLGSTHLPPIPKVSYPRFKQENYQHFNMNYAHVQPFRAEVKSLQDGMYKRKMENDYQRTVKDWQRMNLAELSQLPPQSQYHVKKAITTYLGNSKGSIKALNPLVKEFRGSRTSVNGAS
ncbi:uncharacterized protein LOC116611607 [Nematostella vectensis]|uniref:uncharacterized protein LOC116611607 n=1 Tax=Nematostella vectensis TaxID=45351 RepID=UPI002076E54B|nr:uncharacterized protein LOC116611607 [Nematostella vectensis]XP_048590480.1 uncharacterized protein LOC116611607 [Nematostella vectensis]